LATALLTPVRGKVFLVNHPGFGYLAHDYGLVQKSLEINGQEISPVLLLGLQKAAVQHQWKAIFLQPEHSRRTADALAQTLRLPVIPVDLLVGEWDSTMARGLQTLAGHL
jgi:zinc transport system substrate-binding protein